MFNGENTVIYMNMWEKAVVFPVPACRFLEIFKLTFLSVKTRMSVCWYNNKGDINILQRLWLLEVKNIKTWFLQLFHKKQGGCQTFHTFSIKWSRPGIYFKLKVEGL